MIKIPKNRTYSSAQVEFILMTEMKRVIKDTINQFSACVAMCLDSEAGMESDKIVEVFTEASKVFDSISAGALTLEECFEYLEVHTQIPMKDLFGEDYRMVTRQDTEPVQYNTQSNATQPDSNQIIRYDYRRENLDIKEHDSQ